MGDPAHEHIPPPKDPEWDEGNEIVEGPGSRQTDLDVYIDRRLERMAELSAELADIDEVRQRRTAMIDAWADEESARLRKALDWHGHAIRAVAESYDFGKKKSKRLPHGSFGFRASRDTVEIMDRELSVRFAVHHGLPIKTSETVHKKQLIDHVHSTGELPDPDRDGFDFVPGEDRVFFARSQGPVREGPGEAAELRRALKASVGANDEQ